MEKIVITATLLRSIIEPIPADKFITGIYYNSYTHCACSLGYINHWFNVKEEREYEEVCEYYSTSNYQSDVRNFVQNIVDVNDTDEVNGYTESTPKERVMHLFDDMIAAGL